MAVLGDGFWKHVSYQPVVRRKLKEEMCPFKTHIFWKQYSSLGECLGLWKIVGKRLHPITAYHWEFRLEFTILALSRTLSVLATLYKRLAVNFAKDLFTFQLTKIFNNCLTSKPPILRSSATAHGKQKPSFSFRFLLWLAPAKRLFSL